MTYDDDHYLREEERRLKEERAKEWQEGQRAAAEA